MRSMLTRMRLTASPVTGMPPRDFPINVSPACASASRRGNPRNPHVPLIVWTRRKILSKILALFGSCSNRTNWLSTVSRLSLVSVKNSRNKSSIKATLVRTERATSTRLSERGQLLCKAFKFGFVIGKERSQQIDKSVSEDRQRVVKTWLTINARHERLSQDAVTTIESPSGASTTLRLQDCARSRV